MLQGDISKPKTHNSRETKFHERFSYENKYQGSVVGLDEVGRGPLAGPVIACAAYIDQGTLPEDLLDQIQDSKALSLSQRETVYELAPSYAKWAIGVASIEEIDRYNILQASLLAMHRAYRQFTFPISALLIDGIHAPKSDLPYETLIKGDQKSPSIALASIMAKVTRDRLMQQLAEKHPEYGWEKNAGYATQQHRDAIEKYGITPYHRKSFQPIKGIIEQSKKVDITKSFI